MSPRQQILDLHKEIIVDLFAGGGGMSKAIQMALGRHPDIAINHNDDALSMHRINHPQTRHFVADVFEVDPRTVCKGRPVGHLHASPDCTHHSQAAGGQPRNEKRRALSWVVVRWAGQVKPRIITLENVKQVEKWGPLIAKRDKATGRVLTLDKITGEDGKITNRVAEPGEIVSREKQYLIPDPKRAGTTWRRFIKMLENMGYDVGCKNLVAADFGAGTTRDRLFMHARCDGKAVTFPEPTHFKKPVRGQKKWSAAHEHIDFSIESKSIFDRKKPLAEATMRRIAKGMFKFVINNPNPFIVQVTQSSSNGVRDIDDPLNTITTAKGGEFAMATPVLVQAGHGEGSGNTKRWGSGTKSVEEPLSTIVANGGGQAVASAILVQPSNTTANGICAFDVNEPIRTATTRQEFGLATAVLVTNTTGHNGVQLKDPVPTITTGDHHALATAFLAQANGGFYDGSGNSVEDPVSTITNTGSQQQLITANLVEFRNNKFGSSMNEPVSTITTSGAHHGLVEYVISQDEVIDKALRVAAFLVAFYGTDNVSGIDQPLPTITTKDRLALVTVIYKGTPHYIIDIQFRMFVPPELYSATGFGPEYIFTHGHDGRTFSKAAQVKMCGNAVSPMPGAALISCCHEGDEMRLVA